MLIVMLFLLLLMPQTHVTDSLVQLVIGILSALAPTLLLIALGAPRWKLFLYVIAPLTIGALFVSTLSPTLIPNLRTTVQRLVGRTEVRLTLRDLRLSHCAICTDSESTHFNLAINATSNLLGPVSIGGSLTSTFLRLQETGRQGHQDYPLNKTVEIIPPRDARYVTLSIGVFANSERFATEPEWTSFVVERNDDGAWQLQGRPPETRFSTGRIEGLWDGQVQWAGSIDLELN